MPGIGIAHLGEVIVHASSLRPRIARRLVSVAIAAATLLTAGAGLAQAAPTYPASMASTGDSITRAYNTSWFPYIDNPSASWSTGTNSTVVSQYTRLLALNPAISGHAWNDARSGAKMADLNGQMAAVAAQKPGYVTVLMGGNDVCTSSESTMTAVATFRSQLTAALTTVTTGSPATLVSVSSLPNIYQLWSIFHTNGTARFVWGLFSVCQSMLANATSTAQADVDRRARVLQREVDFNTALAQVCAQFVQCRFDGNALFNTAFTTGDITTRDYFHPSTSGQRKLAAVSWAAGFWGP
jgi:lysophospholipase L1-like esterase